MSKIIIFASVFFILFYSSVIHTNYNHQRQFFPLKLVSNRLRSANSRSQVVPHQVPVEFSRPRLNRFEWEQICQIRYNKLYYQIILFSPTDHANLNLALKTTKIICNSLIKLALKKSQKRTFSNKLKREKKRHNRCHSLNVPKGTQINNLITLKLNNSTNQTSISGSNEFTIEDFTSGILQQISTGNEFTNLFVSSDELPAHAQNFLHEIKPAVMIPAVTPTRSRPIENYPQQIFRQSYGLNPHATSAANRNFFHEINPAVMIPAVTPTRSRPIENYPQQIFRQSYGPNPHAKSAVNRNLLHEINSAVMIPATNSTHPRLNVNYSQQIFMQPYGSKHHVKSAANRNFLREINHVVIISAAKSQTCNISIQFTGSCNQSANFINKRSHDHANDSPHYSQHHQLYLINSEHGDNPSQERLNSVATSSLPSLTENAMQQAPIWKASSSLFTQVERLKAMGIPKTSKYSDTHTHTHTHGIMFTTGLCIPLRSLRTRVSLYTHHGSMYSPYGHPGPVYPSMPTTDLHIPPCSLRTCISLYAHYSHL